MSLPTPNVRLLIAGSRSVRDAVLVEQFIARKLRDDFHLEPSDVAEVVSGGARGVDRLGEDWARRHGIPVHVMRPDWDGPAGRGAGLERNTDLVARATHVLVVWDGVSRGTKDTIDKARAAGKPVRVLHTMQARDVPHKPPYKPKPISSYFVQRAPPSSETKKE